MYSLTTNNNKRVTLCVSACASSSKVDRIDHAGRRVSRAAGSPTRSEGHFSAGPSYLFIWRNRSIIWPHGSREDRWRLRPRRFMTFISDAPACLRTDFDPSLKTLPQYYSIIAREMFTPCSICSWLMTSLGKKKTYQHICHQHLEYILAFTC